MSETSKMLCLLLLMSDELQKPGIFLSWVVETACTVDCVFLRFVLKCRDKIKRRRKRKRESGGSASHGFIQGHACASGSRR